MYIITRNVIAVLCCQLLVACSQLGQNLDSKNVEIVRDQYGVPHIYANETYGLFYGYGYAVGQDRLFQMEMTKRTVLGEVAEVRGVEYVELDKLVRQGFDPSSIKHQLEALNDEERDVFEGYAAGLNRWVQEVRDNRETLMPLEFIQIGFEPSNWTAYDVVMMFAGTMAHRFADFNEEINNLAFLKNLIGQYGQAKGWSIFDTTMPLYDKASPTTVPGVSTVENRDTPASKIPEYLSHLAENVSPMVPLAQNLSGELINIKEEELRRKYLAAHFAISGVSGRAGFTSTSNIWLVNQEKVDGAKAVLVNGPQFGWATPSYVYGVGLHGAGFDVVGNTMLAYPFLLFAHNNHMGWGSTAGFGDLVDIFELKLNPENTEQYMYKGQYRDFDKRVGSIAVKGQSPVEVNVYRSIYGPVIQRDIINHIAYSKKRSWEGSEVATGIAWVELAKAKDLNSFRGELAKMATNINFYYLDKTGNIGYTHSGKYPIRNNKHDNRIPAPGDGSMDWKGTLPFDRNPNVYNPDQGYIANWNNRPARGWRSSDLWWRNWSKADRVDAISDEIEGKTSFSPDEVWDINARTSFADLNISYLLPYLEEALSGLDLSDMEEMALNQLQTWNRYWVDKDKDDLFDTAGPAIMQRWLSITLKKVFRDDIGEEYFYRFASPGYPVESIKGSISVSPGTKILVRNIESRRDNEKKGFDFFNGESVNKILAEGFKKAVLELKVEFGTDQLAWRLPTYPLQFRPVNYLGVPQTLENAQQELPIVMNRGTENNRFVATGTGITGVDVFAPGQSGFIAPDGSKSPHYDDQLELYEHFGHKPLPFSKREVNEMVDNTISLRYSRVE